jgi:polar amino acid transport system substrate-binding protein
MRFAYIDEPPFVWPDGSGWPAGCDAELARAVFARLGVERPEAVLVEFAELLPGLAAGRWDVATPLFVTSERARTVRFSRPVWALGDGLLVRAKEVFAGYEAVADAPDALLGVVGGQVQRETALAAGVPAERIRAFATPEEVVAAVRGGAVAAYASVVHAHRGFLARSPDPALAVVEVASEPAVGAFSFASAAVAEAWDGALEALLGSPEHLRIGRRYGFTLRDGLLA